MVTDWAGIHSLLPRKPHSAMLDGGYLELSGLAPLTMLTMTFRCGAEMHVVSLNSLKTLQTIWRREESVRQKPRERESLSHTVNLSWHVKSTNPHLSTGYIPPL